MVNRGPSGSPSRRMAIRRGVCGGAIPLILFIVLNAPVAASVEMPNPARGETLRVGITSLSTADALDPAMATTPGGYAVARQIFDTLTEFGTEGKLRMRLAESMVPDGSADNWVVTLRKAYWQDGKSVTADDVIFTIKRIMDPGAPLPPASLLSFIDPAGMRKLDDRTVRFRLVFPTMAFADSFASPTLAIVPQGFNPAHPIGSGPFRLDTVEPIVNVWKAPSRPLSPLTWLMAALRMFCAVDRLLLDRLLVPPLPRELRYPLKELPRFPVETEATPMEALLVSLTCEPSWKVAPPPVM